MPPQEEFGDVGLMTGDTSIAPHASCVVMTTESAPSRLIPAHAVASEKAGSNQ